MIITIIINKHTNTNNSNIAKAAYDFNVFYLLS